VKAEAPTARHGIHAVTSGKAGPVVVLLHGFGGLGDVWRDIAAELAPKHRVIAYDLPGHGRSAAYPGSGPPKIAAKAVIDDLRMRGLDRAHVVGHSMGGAIAILIALGAQELVASLTLVAPGGMGEEINAPLLRRFGAAQTIDDIAACLKEMSASNAGDLRPVAGELAAARQTPEQRQRLAEIAELITRHGKQGVIPREMLASLAMPVSVLWGTGDPVLPFAQTRNLPSTFQVQALAGAGHMLIDETPEAIVATLLGQIGASAEPG